MAVTIESRAIHISPEVPDLFVATTHMPKWDRKHEFEEFVASSVAAPTWTCVRRSDLWNFWSSLPGRIQREFPNIDESWLQEDERFIERVLEIQLEGEVFGPINSHFIGPDPIQHDPFLNAVDILQRERTSSFAAERISPRQATLYLYALCRLDGIYAGGEQ